MVHLLVTNVAMLFSKKMESYTFLRQRPQADCKMRVSLQGNAITEATLKITIDMTSHQQQTKLVITVYMYTYVRRVQFPDLKQSFFKYFEKWTYFVGIFLIKIEQMK